jgi:hypothetical protein
MLQDRFTYMLSDSLRSTDTLSHSQALKLTDIIQLTVE